MLVIVDGTRQQMPILDLEKIKMECHSDAFPGGEFIICPKVIEFDNK